MIRNALLIITLAIDTIVSFVIKIRDRRGSVSNFSGYIELDILFLFS